MPKSFYIIDGHAQIFRAYFAPFRDLTSPTGEPTRATYVFTQMLLNLVQNRKPDYLAMVIDAAGDEGVFRKKIDPNYKATRKPRPDDFAPQEARILQICRDAGVPIYFKHGYEADDLIATMVTQLKGKDFETFMVSKDKDLRQVLDESTRLYDIHSDEVVDPKKMEEKLGYTPAEAIDVQTLMGDNIDNVPGVAGVGEKTAVKLIKKYGSAAAVLDHLADLTPKMREAFEAFAPKIDITRRLVTLVKNVDMDFDPEACVFKGLDTAALRGHLTTLGFTSLLTRLGEPARPAAAATPRPTAGLLPKFQENLFSFGEPETPVAADTTTVAAPACPPAETASDCRYHLIATPEQFAEFVAALKQQKLFAFDTETDDLGAMRSNLIGMSFSWEKSTGYYIPVKGPDGQPHLSTDDVLPVLKPILEDATISKVGHNIKYDLLVMRNIGIDLRGIVCDSMIAAFLLDASRMQYGIDRLAMDLINFQKVATVELLGKGKTQVSMDKIDLTRVAAYASEDADITLRLSTLLTDRLLTVPALTSLNADLEVPLIDVLAEMEFNGIAVDADVLKEQSAVLGTRIEELRGQIMTAAGMEFNPDSPKQLAEVLFDRLKLPTGKKTKTGYSTDVQVLERLANTHAVPKLILDYRSLQKLKNTYLDNLTEYQNKRTGRIHGNFNQTGAGTGRLSMSDPNLQNIPIRTDEGRRIRLAFVPGDRQNNVLLAVDYSQIELRILAHFTEEPALLAAFAEDQDIHTAVAAQVFGVPLDQVTREQRGHAKTINFGIIYGVSAFGLSSRIEGLSNRGAQELIDAYNRKFPGIDQFSKKAIRTAQDQGYVETILGRRRPILEINSSIIASRRGAERAAGNTIIQGSAADLIKTAMVRLHRSMREQKMQSKMLLQVHDELVFETPADVVESEAAIIKREMESAMTLKVPLKAEAGWGKNWAETK
jgi:DNA polymerase-1